MPSEAPVAVQKSGLVLLPSQVLRTIHHGILELAVQSMATRKLV